MLARFIARPITYHSKWRDFERHCDQQRSPAWTDRGVASHAGAPKAIFFSTKWKASDSIATRIPSEMFRVPARWAPAGKRWVFYRTSFTYVPCLLDEWEFCEKHMRILVTIELLFIRSLLILWTWLEIFYTFSYRRIFVFKFSAIFYFYIL